MSLISEFRKLQASAGLKGITINEITIPAAIYEALESELFSQCVYQADATVNSIRVGDMRILKKDVFFEVWA